MSTERKNLKNVNTKIEEIFDHCGIIMRAQRGHDIAHDQHTSHYYLYLPQVHWLGNKLQTTQLKAIKYISHILITEQNSAPRVVSLQTKF